MTSKQTPQLISIIITTYNQPQMLQAVLRCLQRQTQMRIEILIADDGSLPTTADCIVDFQRQCYVPIYHIWQKDEGFQAGKIRNKAVAASHGDYLVFLDGDCLVRPNFIAQHTRLAAPGYFVAGNRILCTKAYSDTLLQSLDIADVLTRSFFYWIMTRLKGHINRLLPFYYLPLGHVIRTVQHQRWRGVKSCNLGLWRKDFLQVNGFDESYQGWGYEDSDLVIRLLHAGLQHKSGRYATGVLHLWHVENDRSQAELNLKRLEARLDDSTLLQAVSGVDQYL